MVSLGVVLIHNGDAERITSAREAIAQFLEVAGQELRISLGEVSYQTEIIPASFRDALLSWFLACHLEHRWKVRLRRPKNFSERHQIRRESSWWCRKNLRRLPRRRQRVSIVAALTAKNIRAWQRQLDEQWDYLLVVEDDVVISSGSLGTITALARELAARDPAEALFASLAKAVDLDDLGVSHLAYSSGAETKSQPQLVWFSEPVSNTAAAYVLSKALAKRFYEEVERHRWLRKISADWLLNSLFLRLNSPQSPIDCFHTKHGIFVNRSILGQLPSQTRV